MDDAINEINKSIAETQETFRDFLYRMEEDIV